jgi:LTXXQ motif family protein
MSKLRDVTVVTTLSLLSFVILAASVEARGVGGGGSAGHVGGVGGHVGGGVGRIGGGAFHSGGGGSVRAFSGVSGARPLGGNFSRSGFARGNAPMIGSAASVRSFSNLQSGSRNFTSRNSSRWAGGTSNSSRWNGGTQKSFRQFAANGNNLMTGSVRAAGRTSMLRNTAFASASSRSLARASFSGAFAGKNWHNGNWHHNGWFWRHHHPIIAVGWFGGLFWPFAYWDFIDYTFWPYAYDWFWPYVYDDLYVGMFGPYAYEGPAYAALAQNGRHSRRARARASTATVVCSAQAPALTNWPIQQIADTIQPNQGQQVALNELKDATANAVNALQSGCPEELPSTPTGRLAAMHKRIGTMLLALSLVQPPLQKFYESLSDEQKARFNVINADAEATGSARTGRRPADLSQACGDQLIRPANVPADRIAQALNPNEAQRRALDALKDATTKAAAFLHANCPTEQTLTPPGRVAAMERRLNTMLEAIKIVEPALDSFYGSLTDEQKARFNQLGSSQG